jgi:hypothetical protein
MRKGVVSINRNVGCTIYVRFHCRVGNRREFVLRWCRVTSPSCQRAGGARSYVNIEYPVAWQWPDDLHGVVMAVSASAMRCCGVSTIRFRSGAGPVCVHALLASVSCREGNADTVSVPSIGCRCQRPSPVKNFCLVTRGFWDWRWRFASFLVVINRRQASTSRVTLKLLEDAPSILQVTPLKLGTKRIINTGSR